VDIIRQLSYFVLVLILHSSYLGFIALMNFKYALLLVFNAFYYFHLIDSHTLQYVIWQCLVDLNFSKQGVWIRILWLNYFKFSSVY